MMPVLAGCSGGAERFFQEGDADSLGSADFVQRGGNPGLALHHFGKQGEPNGNDPPILSQALNGLVEKRVLVFRRRRFEPVECAAECGKHVARMDQVEQIDRSHVLALEKFDLHVGHKTAQRHPEVVAHQHDALHVLAVALPQRLGELRVAAYRSERATTARTDRAPERLCQIANCVTL